MIKSNKIGKYVVLEGMDASGKSTQCQLLLDHWRTKGIKCKIYNEPGGSVIGEAIRSILKDSTIERSPESNFDLYTICRREIINQHLRTDLAQGINVIIDRNWWSSVAYQGFGEELKPEFIITQSKRVLGKYFMPDAMILIDVPIHVVEQRLDFRGGKSADYFESKHIEFFQKVRNGYLWLARRYNVPVINGDQTRLTIHQQIIKQLTDLDIN